MLQAHGWILVAVLGISLAQLVNRDQRVQLLGHDLCQHICGGHTSKSAGRSQGLANRPHRERQRIVHEIEHGLRCAALVADIQVCVAAKCVGV